MEEFMSFGLDAFLSVCNNGKTRLLLFDYTCNGSLTGLLYEKRMFLDWDARFLWLGPARKFLEKVTVGHSQTHIVGLVGPKVGSDSRGARVFGLLFSL